MREEEIDEAKKIAVRILAENRPKGKNKRITITKDDKEAFWFLWGIYNNAIEAGEGSSFTEEDINGVSKLRKKIIG